MATNGKHPVVLRMQGMFPKDLGGYEGHRTRKGGDLGHVDKSRSNKNRRLIGEGDWAQLVLDEIADMRLENFAQELAKLRKRRRMTELKKRIAEGPRDPWRGTRHGPLREVILTANRKWFEGFDSASVEDLFGNSREDRFEALAVAWLQEHFGEDVVHARADLDEEAYHIHAVIVPRSETKDGRRMLQPSKHEMVRDYETAQDSVGQWFAQLGLVRGEKRAEAIRNATRHNKTLHDDEAPVDVPKKRRHVSPRDWRRDQERKLAEREEVVTSRERDVDATLEIVEAVESGEIAGLVAEGKTEIAENGGLTGSRAKRARKFFAKALAKLQRRAEADAHAKLRAEFEAIRKADAAIVEAAKHLPAGARKAIAEARTSLAKPLLQLRSKFDKWSRQDRDTGPEK